MEKSFPIPYSCLNCLNVVILDKLYLVFHLFIYLQSPRPVAESSSSKSDNTIAESILKLIMERGTENKVYLNILFKKILQCYL